MTILYRKGNTSSWALIEKVYGVIKGLEDGCTTQDIVDIIEPKETLARVSSVVSAMVICKDPPVSAERNGKRYEGLKVIRPLPDELIENPDRVKRSHSDSVNRKPVEQMTRGELLRLKIAVNEALNKLGATT